THRGLRQRQLRLTGSNADVAGQGAFQAAAHGVAVDGGNRHTAKVAQGFEGFAKAPRHVAGTGLVAIGEQLEVGAGAEELVALTCDHQRINVIVAVEMLDQQFETDQRVAVPGIGWWVVDGDQGGVAVLFHGELVGQLNEFGLIGFNSVAHGFGVLRVKEEYLSSYSRRSRVPPWASRRRAMITRMISLVPSRIWCTRLSRTQRSSG